MLVRKASAIEDKTKRAT